MAATIAPPTPAEPRAGLGLGLPELVELLSAVGDREDATGPEARARLRSGRRALEAELGRLLAP